MEGNQRATMGVGSVRAFVSFDLHQASLTAAATAKAGRRKRPVRVRHPEGGRGRGDASGPGHAVAGRRRAELNHD